MGLGLVVRFWDRCRGISAVAVFCNSLNLAGRFSHPAISFSRRCLLMPTGQFGQGVLRHGNGRLGR